MFLAKGAGKFVSFDRNYRPDLWKRRLDRSVELASREIAQADFVKVSDEELKIISGVDNLANGVQVIHQLGTETVAVTLGSKGTLISNGQQIETVPSTKVDSIDSTGAGDAFVVA